MKDRYLEITYRNGKPFAAYLYLNRKVGTKSSKTKKISDGIVADFDDKGNVIGLEIISPLTTNTSDINKALKSLELGPISKLELAPLKAA